MAFVRDPDDWLTRLSPAEWMRAALADLRQAEAMLESRNARGGIVGLKRAAGMALNAVLIVETREGWGRTYVEHLAGLSEDMTAPEAVRKSAALLSEAEPPGGDVVILRTKSKEHELSEAAKDVIAHVYAILARYESEST